MPKKGGLSPRLGNSLKGILSAIAGMTPNIRHASFTTPFARRLPVNHSHKFRCTCDLHRRLLDPESVKLGGHANAFNTYGSCSNGLGWSDTCIRRC
jgi:hypothetical protein